MKKKLMCLSTAAIIGLFTSCATPLPYGAIMTDVTMPCAATSATPGKKIGTASCQSVLGLVATGDASIATACRNGGITRISHVDWKANNILGIIGTYTCTVYGD